MKLRSVFLAHGLSSAVLVLAGCGGAAPEPATPVAETRSAVLPPSQPPADPAAGPTSSIRISQTILDVCTIDSSPKAAPKFAYNEAAVIDRDREPLTQLAGCLSNGPLKGKKLVLVGRADPRGASAYNHALGAQRANAVATVLRGLGVSPEQVHPTSRGELDAVGTDEAGWALDRRVDIAIAD